jgi:protein required for attachment to host cells
MTDVAWILIADANRARIFINNYPTEKKLQLLHDYSEKDVNKKNSDLMVANKNDLGASSSVESSNPQFHHSNLFANALAKKLEHSRGEHLFKTIMIVAPPAFLGLLKEHLSNEMHKIMVTVEKDYTHDNEEHLVKHLADHLNPLNQ